MSAWFALMLLMSAAMGLRALWKPSTFLEYPTVVGLLMLGWFLPQAWGIERQGPSWVFEPRSAWIYVLMCLVSIWGGFELGRHLKFRLRSNASEGGMDGFDRRRLFGATLAIILLGAIFYFLMIREAETFPPGEQWSGVITAYAFGSQLLPIGAAIALLVSLRTRSLPVFMLFVLAVLIYLPVISTSVKRAPAFELAAIIGGGCFFGRNIVPPRALLIFASVLGIVLIHQAGAMRSFVKENDSTIIEAFSAESTRTLSVLHLERDQVAEVQGAVSDIAIVDQGATIRPFASIWNQLVSQYYPSFVFGREAKDALMTAPFTGEGGAVSRFRGYFGSTRTGFSDTYTSFGPLGVIAFAFVSVLFGWIYERASTGDLRAQLLYLVLLSDGLLVITHSVAALVAQLPINFLVTGTVFALCKARGRPTRRLTAASGSL